MKKLIFGTLFLALVGIGTTGCKKEVLNDNSLSVQNSRELIYKLDKIPLINFKYQDESIKDISDEDELKLDNMLIQLAEATKEEIKDLNFNKKIIELAQSSNTGTVYYSQIKTSLPLIYDRINQRLASENTSIEDITSRMTHAPILPNSDFPETAELEIYKPAIYIPNFDLVNSQLQPIISPNIEVEYQEEDCIVGWYFDESGIQKTTLLSEKIAMETTNPIFILNHAIPKCKMDLIGSFYSNVKKGNGLEKSNTYFNSTKIKIKNGYRYESGLGMKSEFCISGAIVRYNSPPVNFLHITNNNDMSLKIREVKKSEVESSTMINVTSSHLNQNLTPYNENLVYWNTFERDWNRTLQNFGNGSTFNQDWYVGGNARYSGDWYARTPNTVKDNSTNFELFNTQSEIAFDNYKSYYNIVKIN